MPLITILFSLTLTLSFKEDQSNKFLCNIPSKIKKLQDQLSVLHLKSKTKEAWMPLLNMK